VSSISVIVPSYNRPETLKMCLEYLNRQTYRDFDVIVVDDGSSNPAVLSQDDYQFSLAYICQDNAGPGMARNHGARLAKSNVFLFIGDDCLCDRNLVFRHVYQHQRDGRRKAVQGYTMWHPDVSSEFQKYLDEVSGLQANWKALKEDDGSWKSRADGFGLTTNWSIDRQYFENLGGFDKRLCRAAYDDIDLTYRAGRLGMPTIFDPGAINWHYHRYALDSYVRRQLVEGGERVIICLLHPEMTPSLINPEQLRAAQQIDLNEQLLWAKELDNVQGDDVRQAKYNRWGQVLHLASLKGTLKRIDEYPIKAMKAVPHLHTPESIHHVFAGVAALERGDVGYAYHCCEWLMQNSPQNWSSSAFCGEIYLATNDTERARESFKQAMILGAGEQWPLQRYQELR
jgi:GT2 family glycosyltransferase